MKIYQLTSENLTGLGGPMGTERTSINWVKPYDSLEAAQAAANNNYEGVEEFKWTKGTNGWHSQDLGWVMYYIHEVELGGIKDVAPKILNENKIDMISLRKTLQEYMDYVASDKYHEDNDWTQFIYEATLKAFYGKDVFKYINNKAS